MERTGGKRNIPSCGVSGEPSQKHFPSSAIARPASSKLPRLEPQAQVDASAAHDLDVAASSSSELGNQIEDLLEWEPSMSDATGLSTEMDRIPSPLPLYRAPLGSHTFAHEEHGDEATTVDIGVATIMQQSRAKEIEELLGSLCSDDSKPSTFQKDSSTGSLFEGDWSERPVSPGAFRDFSAVDLELFDDSFASDRDTTILDTALAGHIEKCACEGPGEHRGFSIENAMRLKDKIIELFQMTEGSSAMSVDTKLPRAGSIVRTPHGLAMLLIPQQLSVKTDQQPGKNSPSKHKRWTPEEDELLMVAVQNQRGESKFHPWINIATTYFAGNRSGKQCKRRWDSIKGNVSNFSKIEDEIILAGRSHGVTFSAICSQLQGRSTEQVRARFEVINPNKSRTEWTGEEERILITAQGNLGNMWKDISDRLPGRTAQDVKNHWYNQKKLDKI